MQFPKFLEEIFSLCLFFHKAVNLQATRTLKLVGDQVSFLFNNRLDHEDILLLVGKDSIVFGLCLYSDTSLEVGLAFNSSQEVGEGRDLIGEGKSSYWEEGAYSGSFDERQVKFGSKASGQGGILNINHLPKLSNHLVHT